VVLVLAKKGKKPDQTRPDLQTLPATYQELEGYLRNFTGHCQDDWDKLPCLGEFVYNNHVHSSMQQYSFMVNTGRNPHIGFEPQQPRLTLESVNDLTDHMAQGLDKAKVAYTKTKNKYVMYYNHL
jgi:hypothetical protein